MEFIEDLAIILRVVAYQDRDKIVTAITENHGQIAVLAKNSVQSRRFGGSLELFSASHWRIKQNPDNNLGFLERSESKRGFENLSFQFEVLSTASILNELLIKITPEVQSGRELFKLHGNALALLDDLSKEAALTSGTLETKLLCAIISSYALKLLQWGGTQPLLQKCFFCQKSLLAQHENSLLKTLASKAGWICDGCHQESYASIVSGDLFRMSPGELGYMIHLLTHPIRQVKNTLYDFLTFTEIDHILKFVFALLTFHLPGFDITEIKALRFIETRSNLQPLKDPLR